MPIPILFQSGLSEFISIIGAKSAIRRTTTNKIVIINQAYAHFLLLEGHHRPPVPFLTAKFMRNAHQ